MVAEMLREFELNRALTLFVTQGGDFIGEATLYDFDGRGSAEISFRVAREHTRMGYGGKILEGLIEISREIGLLTLKARARKDNEISLSLLKKHGFAEAGAEDSVVFFKQDLSE